jgi:hypothetical protein
MEAAGKQSEGRLVPWRMIGWGAAGFILLLPLIAKAPWTLSDFVVMGVLLGMVGTALEIAVRVSRSGGYRAGAALAVAAGFLLTWVNLAVGFLGSEDNPANAMFISVLGIAIAGAFVAGSDAARMARAMFATAAAQILAGAVGLAAGLASRGPQGIYEVAMGTSLFAGLWLASASLFRRAASR